MGHTFLIALTQNSFLDHQQSFFFFNSSCSTNKTMHLYISKAQFANVFIYACKTNYTQVQNEMDRRMGVKQEAK